MKSSRHDCLLISLIQDLKCLDEILDQILLDAENFELKSWLFPQKPLDECKLSYPSYATGNITYVKCLELIIEKLYIMLNYLNQRKANDERRRNIHYPSRITLGRCAQKCWELANSEENEKASMSSINSSTNFVINKGCQTNIRSLDKCDSCFEMDEFLKNMVKFLSENFEESTTKNSLSNMNETIFSTTKFGRTLKFADAIKQDYKNLANKLNENSEENNILMGQIGQLRITIDTKELEIKELNVLKHKLTENLTNSDKKLDTLNDRIRMMEEEKERLQQSCDTYGPILEDITNQVKKLRVERIENEKKIEFKVDSYKEKIAGYEAEVAASDLTNSSLQKDLHDLRSKHGELYCKYSKMCKMYKKLEQNLEDIDDFIKDVDNMSERTQISVKKVTDGCTELNEKIKRLRKNYDEEESYTNKFFNLHKVGSLRGRERNEEAEKYGIQGNPFLDFKRQIEENEQKIKKLEDQNKKFAKIVKLYQKEGKT